MGPQTHHFHQARKYNPLCLKVWLWLQKKTFREPKNQLETWREIRAPKWAPPILESIGQVQKRGSKNVPRKEAARSTKIQPKSCMHAL